MTNNPQAVRRTSDDIGSKLNGRQVKEEDYEYKEGNGSFQYKHTSFHLTDILLSLLSSHAFLNSNPPSSLAVRYYSTSYPIEGCYELPTSTLHCQYRPVFD
jgi:hypothetical protein